MPSEIPGAANNVRPLKRLIRVSTNAANVPSATAAIAVYSAVLLALLEVWKQDALHFFYGLPRLVFLTAPLAFLFFDAQIFHAAGLMIMAWRCSTAAWCAPKTFFP